MAIILKEDLTELESIFGKVVVYMKEILKMV